MKRRLTRAAIFLYNIISFVRNTHTDLQMRIMSCKSEYLSQSDLEDQKPYVLYRVIIYNLSYYQHSILYSEQDLQNHRELMTTCGVRVLLNASYEYLKYDYGILRSTITINLRNICHPLKYRTMRHLKQRTNTG